MVARGRRLVDDVPEDADRRGARSSTTRPRARPSSSSSTATTSPTARTSPFPRSWRRARAFRRTRCSASRTCSSSCSPTTGRRASRSRGTRGPCTAGRVSEELQVRAPADAGPPARAVPALPADRRGVRLPQPRVRGLGGGRRHRHARDAGRRGRRQDVRRLDRPRRLPARLGERLPDDDAARRRGRPGLHARAGRGALRRCRPEQVPDFIGLKGDTSDNIPGIPGHRRQDRRPADRAVRLARGRARARRELSPARRKNVAAHADQARASKVLATMRRDLDARRRPGRARPGAARPLAS